MHPYALHALLKSSACIDDFFFGFCWYHLNDKKIFDRKKINQNSNLILKSIYYLQFSTNIFQKHDKVDLYCNQIFQHTKKLLKGFQLLETSELANFDRLDYLKTMWSLNFKTTLFSDISYFSPKP